MIQYLETTAGQLYADCDDESEYVKYVEIGLYVEEKHIPIAALEVRTKKISKEIDPNVITRVLYNPKDEMDVKFDVVYKKEKKL